MNEKTEKTRAVIFEFEGGGDVGPMVDIYHGNEYIGYIEGQVTRLSMESDRLIVHVKRDGERTGLIVADTIEKGGQ